jgi:hypothetical protein
MTPYPFLFLLSPDLLQKRAPFDVDHPIALIVNIKFLLIRLTRLIDPSIEYLSIIKKQLPMSRACPITKIAHVFLNWMRHIPFKILLTEPRRVSILKITLKPFQPSFIIELISIPTLFITGRALSRAFSVSNINLIIIPRQNFVLQQQLFIGQLETLNFTLNPLRPAHDLPLMIENLSAAVVLTIFEVTKVFYVPITVVLLPVTVVLRFPPLTRVFHTASLIKRLRFPNQLVLHKQAFTFLGYPVRMEFHSLKTLPSFPKDPFRLKHT